MLSTYVQFLCFLYTLFVVSDKWWNSSLEHLDVFERFILVSYVFIFGLMASTAVVWLYTDQYASYLYDFADYCWMLWACLNTYILTKNITKERKPSE